jgi:hypothetical protein
MLKFTKSEKYRLEGRISPDETIEVKKKRINSCRTDDNLVMVKEAETNQFDLLFEKFDNLKKSAEDFENFLSVVSNDLIAKTEALKNLKNNESTKRNDRSFASVQLFMLSQYSHRINRFRTVSRISLENIRKKHEKEINVDDLVIKHIDILTKMKRRMKHIIDVSEKYAVTDIFDTINLLREMSEEMDPSVTSSDEGKTNKKMNRRHCKSMMSLEKVTMPATDTVDSSAPLPGEEMMVGARSQKMNTFKSLTDHLSCLTKTYTSRR